MEVDYKEIGRRIARRRKYLGYTQLEVCEKAELSDKYLSCIERARSIPSVSVLMKLTQVLETTPDALLLGAVDYETDPDFRKIAEKLKGLDHAQLLEVGRFIDFVAQKNSPC